MQGNNTESWSSLPKHHPQVSNEFFWAFIRSEVAAFLVLRLKYNVFTSKPTESHQRMSTLNFYNPGLLSRHDEKLLREEGVPSRDLDIWFPGFYSGLHKFVIDSDGGSRA